MPRLKINDEVKVRVICNDHIHSVRGFVTHVMDSGWVRVATPDVWCTSDEGVDDEAWVRVDTGLGETSEESHPIEVTPV